MARSRVSFDHIEVHVVDVPSYAQFLQVLFDGGRSKQISESGTMMFISPEGLNIEIKFRTDFPTPANNHGFCLPCIRMEGARRHIETTLGLTVDRVITNPEGEVFFFRDREDVEWHIKDYVHRDRYIEW